LKLIETVIFDISKELRIRFGMPTQALVSETLTSVANAVTASFVPNFLGYSHITRKQALAHHTPAFASTVLETQPGELIGVLDGTYLYIDSPTDYGLQRKTYSGQKKKIWSKV